MFVLAYAVADIVVARTGSVQPVLARTAVDLALTLPFFWLLLALTRRTHRFPQTINAALGVYVLLTPIIIVLLLLRNPAQSNGAIELLLDASFTIFMIWYLLIVGPHPAQRARHRARDRLRDRGHLARRDGRDLAVSCSAPSA